MSCARPTRQEAGYALLLVVFLVALMTIAAAVAAPSILTQGQREKEEEMIWRGKQYVRAIRAFYRKNGRFPQRIEDLTEKKVGNLRYLRQAYKDPMNREDGSWRLIYVAAGGQLIGSVNPRFGTGFGPFGGQVQVPSAQPGKNPAGSTFGQPMPAGTSAGSSGTVFGGNIIGVGSKVDKPSLKVYDGKQRYKEWEFIWDPTKEAGGGGFPGAPGQQPRPGQPPQPQQPNPPMRP